MQAIQVYKFGGPEVLQLAELPMPAPGADQVLVKVASVGVNFMDTQIRAGLYKGDLPLGLGTEGAGIVERAGPGVTAVKEGDRVAWILTPGTYGSHVVVSLANLVKVPDRLAFNDAAAALYQGMTAHFLVHATHPLQAGQSCLVHSGAGGVGSLLCQMARLCGARVFATVSDDAKIDAARAAGAEHVIQYKRENVGEVVRRHTDGKGVDVVYDAVGAATFEASLASLARRGLLALYGESSGEIPPFVLRRLSRIGSLFVTRAGLHDYIATRDEFDERAQAVFDGVVAGSLRVHIERVYPLVEAAVAHRDLESRKTIGKLLLVP